MPQPTILHVPDPRQFVNLPVVLLRLRGESALAQRYLSAQQRAAAKQVRSNGVSLDAKALAVFIEHPDWTKKRIAEHLRCNEKSLSPQRCPKLAAAYVAYRAPILPKGVKDADGNLEAWDG